MDNQRRKKEKEKSTERDETEREAGSCNTAEKIEEEEEAINLRARRLSFRIHNHKSNFAL